MPLLRMLDNAGLHVAATRARDIASRPHSADMRPQTRIRNARRQLRRWLDGSSDSEIEQAIGELLIAALVAPVPAITDRSRPVIEVKRRLASSNSQ